MGKVCFRRVAISPPGCTQWTAWGTGARTLGAEALMIRNAVDVVQALRSLSDLGLPLVYNGLGRPPEGVAAVHHKSSARHGLWPGVLNGRSCHTFEEAAVAVAAGYDYIFFSPVFATRSHPDVAPVGLEALRRVCETLPIPVFALGGVNRNNERLCFEAGAYGVAGIDGYWQTMTKR